MDVKVLKQARYLRRVRGLNAAAIVDQLRGQGLLAREGAKAKDGNQNIGRRLRHLRAQQKKSLAQVAREAGISVGFLSAIERSQMSASVGTLRRLARIYDLNILDFFDASDGYQPLVKPRQRKRLQAGPGVGMELLAWGNTVMEPHLFRVAPGAGSGDSYSHEGEEFLFILKGQLDISLEGERYNLRGGDSFYFQSKTQHHWRNPGKSETSILWINTPPTF
jgi:transcriptional regulator with XRE-family HTH domain